VNNLLTLSRMDAGQTSLNTERVDLSDVAVEVAERLQPLAGRQGLKLTTGELPEAVVAGDRQYLIQMISNLVENGLKYSAGIGSFVRLDVGRESAVGGGTGWIRVQDDGPGIPSADLPYVFDRFYQVERARSKERNEALRGSGTEHEASGSGLGLSIVQWIARAHGGEVSVTSQLGTGAAFEVRLPLPAK
jgi:signal transduction histidine kinase